MADERRDIIDPGETAVFRPGEATRDRDGVGYRPLSALQGWSRTWPDWAQGAAGRVQAFDPDDLTTGQVLGIAIGAATAAGSLVVALQPEPPLPQGVERSIRALPKGAQAPARRAARRTRRGGEAAGARAAEARGTVEATAQEATARASEAATTARVNVGRGLAALGSAAAASGAALAAGDDGGNGARPAKGASAKELRRAAEQERKRAEKARKEAAKAGRGRRAAKAVAGAREGAGNLATGAGDGLASLGDTLASTAGAVIERVKPGEEGTVSAVVSAVQNRIDTATSGGRKLTGRDRRNLQRQVKDLRKQARQLQKEADKRAKQARKQVPSGSSNPLDVLRERLPSNNDSPLEAVRKQLPGGNDSVLETVRKRLPGGNAGALDTARARAGDAGESVSKGLAAAGVAVASAAAPLLDRVRDIRKEPTVTERVREGGANLGETLTETASKVATRVSELAGSSGETLGGAASKVASRVTDLASSGGEAASKAVSRVTDRAGDSANTGRSALQSVAKSSPLDRASDLAGQVGQATRETARDTGKAVSRGGGRVASVAGNAVGATANATKETGLILFWGAALGGLVLYGLLNDEQRAKVLATASSIFEQGRELVRDFQGYDEEF